jgi:aspartyl-tRNA(Asn)/glutamyl-tRNA(Gln) amidotransferase subunit B
MKPNSITYWPTIGIESHVQLKTKTKLFAAVKISDDNASPNTSTSHICFGMPGALPVLNKEAVNLAIKAAFALNTIPQKFSKFDRKHYFYPDLPKGYQITQYDEPIILGGYVTIRVNDEYKKIKITRAHLEEDAGKTIHPVGKNYSLVDLNRAGVPLLEIVSEPEMHNPVEAREYARELNLVVRYAEVSNADLYLGNMRFDINVSVSKDKSKLGTRTEIKNLNSFKSVEKAAEYEIKRQIELLNSGKEVLQETRGWDDAKQRTIKQRSKEDAHDYRYFPEPDIPPIVLSDKDIKQIKDKMPVSVDEIRSKLLAFKIDGSAVETLLDNVFVGRFMFKVANNYGEDVTKKIGNWLSSEIPGYISEKQLSWEDLKLNIDSFVELAKLVETKQISSTSAKAVLFEMIVSGRLPKEIADDLGLIQVSSEDTLLPIIRQVLDDNPDAVKDLKSGETKVMGYLIGQVMKASKGSANPEESQKLIKKVLGL